MLTMGVLDHVVSFHEPKGLAARGTLVVVPGRGEQPAVYRRFGARMATDAYRVHVVSDPTVDADHALAQLRRATELAVAPRPVVLVGSDSGALFTAGLVAATALSPVDGVVLAGLIVREERSFEDVSASWDEELDARTTCPTHRGRISDAADALVRRGALYEPVPAEWVRRLSLDAVDVPILGIHGQDDVISPLDEVREHYASAHNTELVSIAQARHDVLNDQSRRSVAATLMLWLERLRLSVDLTPIVTIERLGGASEPLAVDVV